MGDLMPGIPSVPGDETTWAAAVDQFETLKKGDMPLSLTNWDASSTKPAIAAGSAIEIAGATYRFNSEAPILDITGVVAGTVHCGVQVNDPVSGECTAFFINGDPGWRDDLNGWYNAEGTFRYTGHMMDWDGADAYTNKRIFIMDGPGGAQTALAPSGAVYAHSVITDNVFLKSKKYTGTYTGDDVTFSHGLDSDKILSAIVAFWLPSTTRWATDGAGGTIWWDATSIYHYQDGIGSPAGTPYKALVLYEE